MDKIVIRGLLCELKIGVEEEERLYPQICRVSLELLLDLKPAAKADSVAATVDYARLCEEVQQVGAASEYRLVEAFAEAIAASILKAHPVQEVKVFVEKTPLPLQGKLESVGVEIVRKR